MFIDIISVLLKYCNITEQINICEINKYLYDELYIFSLDVKNIKYFDNAILKQKRYSKMQKLDCSDNKILTNIDCINDTLKILLCNGKTCGINQESISGLRILE